MTTTLEPSFLRSVVLMTSFHASAMLRTQAALLWMALKNEEFTAAQLPGEITNGNTHLAGAATGALIAQGLLVVVGRVKSPLASAKGRKLDVLRLAQNKRSVVRTWLERNGFEAPQPAQAMLYLNVTASNYEGPNTSSVTYFKDVPFTLT